MDNLICWRTRVADSRGRGQPSYSRLPAPTFFLDFKLSSFDIPYNPTTTASCFIDIRWEYN